MRALILIAGAALAISGCGKDQAAENTANADSSATAEQITSNDTTAIDAATGDDANMAADVDYTINELDDDAADNAAGNTTNRARTSPRSTASESAREPARDTPAEPANTVQNSE